MFWRAARGRVGPNSRSALHMAIFLLNPYGPCSCILVPKCSPVVRKHLPSVGPPKGTADPPGAGEFASSYASVSEANTSYRSTSSPSHHMALHPTFLILLASCAAASVLAFAGLQAAPRAGRIRQSVLAFASLTPDKRRSERGHLTFIKKYDIIFKKRMRRAAMPGGGLTTLKKYDIINKKTSIANRD